MNSFSPTNYQSINDKSIKQITNDLNAMKKLLILLLQHQDVKGEYIARALGVSEGRVSQIFTIKKYKKRRKNNHDRTK